MKFLTAKLPERVWRSVLLGWALCVLAGGLGLAYLEDAAQPAAVAHSVVCVLALAGWIVVIGFVLIDSWGRRVWPVVLTGALAMVLFLETPGLVAACTFSSGFLALRQYSCWRKVSDRRRAAGFGLGIVALVLVVGAFQAIQAPAAAGATVILRRLGLWSTVSLSMFWSWSLFHLAIRMRLHFLRLRPKLAVFGLLIGIVPLVLVVLLAMVALYSGMGGARAARTQAVLENWRSLADRGADLGGALYDTTFAWPATDAALTAAQIPAPDWVPEMARRLPGHLGEDVADTTGWFLADESIWLMRWRGLGGEQPTTRAWQLGTGPLTELSHMLKTGIEMSATGSRRVEGGLSISPADSQEVRAFPGLDVSYRQTDGPDAFWDKWLFFGGTIFEVMSLRDDRVRELGIFVNLRVGPADLKAEFLEGDTNVNIMVVVALAILTFLFLVLEAFALFFGVRISEGVVTGVHALRRGTRAVAAGDLETVIKIPNEDEFGDLARSFNEMTAAVRHGREIALANERLVQELATARGIQLRLLPGGEPAVVGFEVTGASIPSREVGGDYYDFVAQTDDCIGIAIGDVSGKGMPAALLMSNLQASLHGQVLHPGTVASVVQRVNDLLVRSTDPHMFATFFYGLLEVKTGRFICTNAGHNPPLLLRRDGSLENLSSGGLLLGMIGDQVYKQDTVVLQPGEVIVMYTDGITEAIGPSAEEDDPEAMFGEEALHEVVRRNRHLPATGIKDAILAAVAAHTLSEPQSDDITLVVIRRQE